MHDAEHCRARALECRKLAERVTDRKLIDHLLFVAAEYEALAAGLEQKAVGPTSQPIIQR